MSDLASGCANGMGCMIGMILIGLVALVLAVVGIATIAGW